MRFLEACRGLGNKKRNKSRLKHCGSSLGANSCCLCLLMCVDVSGGINLCNLIRTLFIFGRDIGDTLESTTHNRTARIIEKGDGGFTVSVTERDYIDDPSGQRITVVVRDDYAAIDAARAGLKAAGRSFRLRMVM